MSEQQRQDEAIMVEYFPGIELSETTAKCVGILFVDMQPAWCIYETGKTYLAKEVLPFKDGKVDSRAKLRKIPSIESRERAMQSIEAIFQIENAGKVTMRKDLGLS